MIEFMFEYDDADGTHHKFEHLVDKRELIKEFLNKLADLDYDRKTDLEILEIDLKNIIRYYERKIQEGCGD